MYTEPMYLSLNLTPAEVLSIAFDLRTAADQYTTDAATCDAANNPRLAEQFRLQARRSRALADRLEN